MARGIAEDGPHPVDRHVGRRVMENRTSLGYTQSDLGRALGLTFQQIQKYEKGSNRMSASRLWDIARFLQVDVACFFAGLADADAGAGIGDGRGLEPAFPATRESVEIARAAPRLSNRQQKLALDLITEFVGTDLADR